MAIIVGDSTDGVRTGLAGRIANAVVSIFASVTYGSGTNHQKGLNSLVQGIVDALNSDKVSLATQVDSTQEAWNTPTLLNSYTAPRSIGYFKDSLGIVHLRGTATGGSADTIFTLPVGYRPSQLWIFATDHNGLYGRILVQTTGNVDSDLTLHTNAVLDGITFDTR